MLKEKPDKYREFYHSIYEKFLEYRKEITEIGFAYPETMAFSRIPMNIDDFAECLQYIMNVNVDLNRILEVCPDSIYVVDKDGVTLRANRAFKHTTGTDREDVLGKNVYDMEKLGYYYPSINGIALKEQKAVSIIQMGKNGRETVVTGVPVFNGNGEIYRSVSNAKLLDEINAILRYKESQENLLDIQKESKYRMVCESPSMKEIKYMVDHIMDTNSSILITGETGVGKGILTRYIHEHSRRKEHRLIEINCGAIPETLLESELFGYESGAFTGADKRGKPGLIELADGGTIFFDEVNELPLMLQVKLLHFLQNKRITRVGGTKEIDVDARIIAASNKNLAKLVREEEFRADLFYRLNVIPIEIPPLRERPEDIVAAVESFLDKYNTEYGKNIKISKSYIDELLNYNWPGNLRQLENHIERAVVTCKHQNILGQNAITEDSIEPMSIEDDSTPSEFMCPTTKTVSLYDAKEELEKQMVINSYKRNKSSYKVALELGISQASAYRKILKHVKKEDKSTM